MSKRTLVKIVGDEDQGILKSIADLKVKAMMFNMDIDWETLELIPIVEPVKDPYWLQNIKEKREQSDNDPSSPQEAILE